VSEARESRAIPALLLGAAGIACAPIFVRYALDEGIGPSAAAFYRLLFAMPVAWAWALRQGAHRRPADARERLQLCIPGLCFAGDLAVWHWSIHWTSVANSTLLANFQPVFVTLGGWILFKRRFRKLFLLGMAVALVGAVLLVNGSFGRSAQQFRGDLLGLLTAVFYASYFLSVGWLRERFTTPTILAYAVTVAAAILAPIAWASGEALTGYSTRGWLDVVALALVSQVLGQGLIIYALAHLPAHFGAVTLLLQPVLATMMAWWLFGETLGGREAWGAALVLAGIVTARRGS